MSAKGKQGTGLNVGSLQFMENKGQWNPKAEFLAQTPNLNLWVTRNSLVYEFYQLKTVGKVEARKPVEITKSGQVVGMHFVGSSSNAKAVGVSQRRAYANFIRHGGNLSNVPTFGESRVNDLYTGIDARVYLDQDKPRYDLIVRPGADPSQIRIKFEGAEGDVSVTSTTSLEIKTRFGASTMGDLYAYQMVGTSKVSVPVSFAKNIDGTIGFRVGNYDRTKPLIIDPIVYSTLLGGVGADIVNDVDVDNFGNAYVTGQTSATDFPTVFGSFDENRAGTDAFITKVLPDGTDLVYSTFIGGTAPPPVNVPPVVAFQDMDSGNGIRVNSLGEAVICGVTSSPNFPIKAGAIQSTNQRGIGQAETDGFVLKLNAAGTDFVWSTYLGGTGNENVYGMDMDSNGDVYIGGSTTSGNFPLVNAFMTNPSPNDNDVFNVNPLLEARGDFNGFVTKINGAGTAIVYSTYLGAVDLANLAGDEEIFGIAASGDGFAYVTGYVGTPGFPTTAGVWDQSQNGFDAFVTKFNQAGSGLVYSTFLGGNNLDFGISIAIDGAGFAYVIGQTQSFNFPRTAGAFDTTYNLATDCFLTKLDRKGEQLVYSTLMGVGTGSGDATTFTPVQPSRVIVDDLGGAYVVGLVPNTTYPVGGTVPGDFTTFNGPTAANHWQGDGFLLVFNESGSGLIFSSYYGGERRDWINSIALDSARGAYLVGFTQSSVTDANGNAIVPFPTFPNPGAFKINFGYDGPLPGAGLPFEVAAFEGFIVKTKVRVPLAIASVTINPNSVAAGETAVGTVTISQPASTGGATVSLNSENAAVVQVPPSVFIPEGQTTATFNVTTTADITDKFVVKVNALVEGDTKFATITVAPWLDSLTLSNATVIGGNLVGGRVNLFRPAPAGGITVTLVTTDATVATVPANVTVPAGLTTATFDVDTVGVAADVQVTISGAFAGMTRTVDLTVKPASLQFFTFSPNRVAGGSSTTGTVTLDGEAPPGGLNVALQEVPGDYSFIILPAGPVTIGAGQRSATFTVDTTFVGGNTFGIVRATVGSVAIDTVLNVDNVLVTNLTLNPSTVPGGGTSTGTVQLNQPAPPGGVVVNLQSSDPVLASMPASVTVPAGGVQAQFTITTTTSLTQQIVDITATRGSSSVTKQLTILPIDFSITISPNNILGGQSSTGTITLTGPAPVAGVTVNLTKASQAPNPPDATSNVTIPASVSFTSGQTTRTFPITTTGVQLTDTIIITGTAGSAIHTANLTVRASAITGITFVPSTVKGLKTTLMTVTLDGPAPAGGAVVSIDGGTNAQIVNLPATVTIPAGSTSTSVTVTTNKVSRTLATQVTGTYGSKSVFTLLTVTR